MNIFRRATTHLSRRLSTPLCCAGLFLVLVAASDMAFAQADLPANIDNGLRRFMSAEQGNKSAAFAQPKNARSTAAGLVVRDSAQRVLIEIHLNGSVPLESVRNQLTDMGAKITSETRSYREGGFTAFIPANRIAEAARSPGVLSLTLSHRPRRNVGAATSGGVFVLHTDKLNAQGIDGTGETVGVLSDSYDTATTTLSGDPLTIHAAQDIATDDLPGPGNSDNPNPVVVIEDFNDPSSTDEGRAMLQIVHDVAPKAKLAFASAFFSKMDFADNIRKLRTDANCNVIVDDVLYTEEPMFSDGIIAQAVDDVVTSTVLDGPKCAYFSSATNYQGGGYVADFNPVSDTVARAGLPNQNIQLNQVPTALTSGGFHNFNPDPNGPVDISQTFIIPAQDTVEFDFQWNDPFDQTPMLPDFPGVTTDYNILIFDEQGNYLDAVSGTDDNFATQEAIEDVIVDNPGDTDLRYQIVIARAGTTPATPVASKIRYLALDNFGGVGAEEYYQEKAPTGHGHNSAVSAISVGAYVYDDDPSNPVAPPFTPFVEEFTSTGPATIFFDASGKRLNAPDIRMKPEISAPDGGNTTFFGDDYEGDGLPNFFGTSAAAPHAAGVAALLFQKAGGPESLTNDQLRNILENSITMQHDLDPFVATAVTNGVRKNARKRFSGGTVTVTGTGNSSNASAHDVNFFNVTFNSTIKNETLTSISIDLTNAGLKFDTTSATGFPLTLGRLVNINRSDIFYFVQPGRETVSSITLAFSPGKFKNSTSVSFGIDRDFIGDGGGNTGDYLEGGVVTATTTINNLKGVFMNTYGFGWTFLDGFGLIDAAKAAQLTPPAP
jgi:hypothetical protein